MNAFLSKGIIIVTCIFQCTVIRAQLNLSKYQIGATAGMFIYQGDLTPSQFGSFQTPRFTGSIFISRILSNAFSLRTNLSVGSVAASDSNYAKPEWRQQRNFSFRSPVIEISQLLVWHPTGNQRLFSPYLFGGAGISFLQVRRDYSKFNGEYFSNEPNVGTGLNEDLARTPPRLFPVIPLGAGLQYNYSEKISFIAESSYRLTLNDYIDGFSKAANPDKFDHYQNYSIGVIFKFGKRAGIDCPVVKQ